MIKIAEVNDFKFYTNGVSSDTAVIFMHGVPFNAKLWLPVMEKMPSDLSCYAVDLKGFGLNAGSYELMPKEYTLLKQIEWLELFLNSLKEKNFIFVMHGWSSVPATLIAQKLSNRVTALAYFEAQIRAVTSPDMLSLPMQSIANSFLEIDDIETWVIKENGYAKTIFNMASIGKASDLEDNFAEQLEEPACRAATLQYLYELPLGFKRSKTVELIESNSNFIARTNASICLFYAVPGFMTTMSTVRWAKENVSNIHLVDLDYALHCAPMTLSEEFATNLRQWLQKIAITQ